MSKKINRKIEEARNSLIQSAMKEIYDSLNSPNFYLRVFCVIARFGLQQEAKKEGLITSEESLPLERKEQYLQKINQFLIKYIR